MPSKICNRILFIEVATDALESYQLAWCEFMALEGNSGSIKKLQAHRRALKSAVVALTFSGKYIDAALHFHGRAKLGRYFTETAISETKLKELGFNDEVLLQNLKQLRVALRELSNGKELELHHHEPSKVYVLQNEAEKAVAVALRLKTLLND